ncbi:MAG: ABC transporter ATP-binding protein [Betaproteobacteria bacterium]|nr:ABC transporter ATP-binding protein [Betaproteobacteria bacterium]
MTPAIEVSHLTKEYRLGAMTSLREGLRGLGARLRGRERPVNTPFKALDDVSFTVQPGEVVGIIGHNGAGKSTLLKMLARISTPTRGSVKVNGRIAPLIEVGAGFVGDFTGRENVYLNGAILGMKRKEIDRKFDEIVAFAEMEQFIDTPVKRYSSGMQVKLAFAVATSIESEILIVDEVLAVGDLAFQRKSFERMESLIRAGGRAVLLVSHNIRQIERICGRALLLEHGKLIADGPAIDVCNTYFDTRAKTAQTETGSDGAIERANAEWPDVKLMEIRFEAPKRGEAVLIHDEPASVTFRFRTLSPIPSPVFGIGIEVTWQIERVDLLPGLYHFRVGVAAGEVTVWYAESFPLIRVVSGRLSSATVQEMGFVELKATATLKLGVACGQALAPASVTTSA